jgi:signal transduction histidine kinase
MDDNPPFDRINRLKPYFETNDTLWSSDGNQFFTENSLPKESGYVFEHNLKWDSLSSPYRLPIGLKLPYDQNYLRFSYANHCILNYDQSSFRYMLSGSDDEWQYANQETETKNYFNLSPGAYTFRVSTKGVTAQWGPPTEFKFQITPPWWKTWWAYLGYVLLAFGAIWSIVQYRSRRLKRENRLLEEKVAHRTKKLKESIDNLKATQAQLIHSEKMASLGELTAGIAHEIQNPLNFVNNFSEVNAELTKELEEEIEKGDLEEAKAIAKDIKENEEKIMYHGKRAESIVKGMLQHSRSSSGEKSLTDINALVDEYLRLAYHGFRAKDKSFNSKFETDFDETLEKINVVPQEIGRVMLNLITNAFHAVREKSKNGDAKDAYQPSVSVKTEKQDGQVLIEVSDNGSGMPAEVKNKIFQPFFTTKPTGEGTGLGLSMSFDIIKLHKGKISVDSVEGEGTTFHITLPITNPK